MTYVYRNGVEYLVKYTTGNHDKPMPAKPRKFGQLANIKRRDKHAD